MKTEYMLYQMLAHRLSVWIDLKKKHYSFREMAESHDCSVSLDGFGEGLLGHEDTVQELSLILLSSDLADLSDSGA